MSARSFLPCCLTILLAAMGAGAAEPPDEQIRPFDKVYLKVSPNEPLVGILQAPWDPESTAAIVIRDDRGTTMRLARDQIADVTPRQTAEQVYARKLAKVEAEKDPARRASAEFALGRWCAAPHAALGGAAPRSAKALEHLLSAVRLAPSLAEAYPYVIALLPSVDTLAQADVAGVERDLEVALLAERGGVRDPEIDFRRGMILAKVLQQPEKAMPLLERVVASAHENRSQVRAARATLRDIYLARGDVARATALYESAIVAPDSSPSNFEAFYEIARLHALRGDAEGNRKARESYEKARALQPDFLEIAAELAALEYREGKLSSAEKLLRDLLERDPENVSAGVDLAIVLRQEGRRADAEKALLQLVPRADGSALCRAHLALGALRDDQGEARLAAEEYRKALQADPGSAEARLSLALALVGLGEVAEARKLADSLLAEGGTNPWLFAAASRVRGEAELRDKRTDAAVDHLRRAAGVERGKAALLERAGLVLLGTGKLDEAHELLRRAQEVDPERPGTLNGLAHYHYARGEYGEARKLFDEVLRLVPAPAKVEKGAPAPVPVARAYALQGRELIDDLERLEVWTADFRGPDDPTLGGWLETERFGIEISRNAALVVLAGKQAGSETGVTSAMLDRPIDPASFDRVRLTARIDSGRARPALRLEGISARGGAAVAGIAFLRDYDGVLRFQLRTTQKDWELVQPTEDTAPEKGRLVFPGTVKWPDDKAFHTLEIRRAPAVGTGATSTRVASFHLFFDGQPVAWNVKVGGLAAVRYSVGFSAETDALGNEYSVSVESFRVYRERPGRRKPEVRK